MLPSLRALPLNGNLPKVFSDDDLPPISDQPVYRVAIGFFNYQDDPQPVPATVACSTYVPTPHPRIPNEWLRGVTSLAWLKAGVVMHYGVVTTTVQWLQNGVGANRITVDEYNWSPNRLLESMVKEMADSMRLLLGNGFVVSVNTTEPTPNGHPGGHSITVHVIAPMLQSLRSLPVNGNLPTLPDEILNRILDEVPPLSEQPMYDVAIGFFNYKNDPYPVPHFATCRTSIGTPHPRIPNEWLRGVLSLAWIKAGAAMRYEMSCSTVQLLQYSVGSHRITVNEFNWSPNRLLECMVKETAHSMRLRLGNGFVVSVNITDAIPPGTFIIRHSYENPSGGLWPARDYTTPNGFPAIHTITVHAFPMARVMNTSLQGYVLGRNFTHKP
jgi:hypothetical protein